MTDDSHSDTTHEPVRIGSILSSNSHLDYTVEVFGDRDCERPPEPHEREFGQPVYIATEIDGTQRAVVGVIYDTRLVDPDQGRTGPRLAQDDQAQFTPAYVEERTTLAGVALLGTARLGDDGTISDPSHQMPRWTLSVDDTVRACPDAMVRAFHHVDGDLRLAYVDRLLEVAGDLGAEVVEALIERLRGLDLDDESRRVLDVVDEQVTWQARQQRGLV
ncbi:hypothetical protein [Halococcoides cellulosivorans]|uniref:DUF8166 domain-containing protein n=1 Tax=Halococcoides cellulosivorans TaxID=1679096 RepID=A0A2R4X1B2_9EURY|nr:hypothetical protein [Halococcoides cellulosivorans]AWB27578.1 hypothetical protein HARCEL1_07570 [Halococcoides cellulosivorans]